MLCQNCPFQGQLQGLEPESLDRYLNPQDDEPKDPEVDPEKGNSDNA